jgi:hypothetical protein
VGYDQGNVPVTVIVDMTHCKFPARIGSYLFALLFLHAASWAGDDLPANRCGFDERAVRSRVRIGNEVRILGTRPVMPKYAESVDGRFRVHYTLKGSDAVDSADINSDGIPDYVHECLAALDRSWRLEVDTLNYTAPPTDDTTGGSSAIDVYLRDLGRDGYYGVTNLDRLLALTPSERYTTWMEIDNNFSPTDSTWSGKQSYATFGVDALRVTCAHELHHVIQNGSYGYSIQHRMIYELTSTWMEMRAYPEVRDWAVWTSFLLTRPELWPFSKTNPLNGYCWGWFGNVLTAQPSDLLRSTWNIVAKGTDPFVALSTACAEAGTSLPDVFCSSMGSLYQTGKRAVGNLYLPQAELLPEIKFFSDITVQSVAERVTGNIRPFEVRAIRANVPSLATEPISLGQIVSWTSDVGILYRQDSALEYTMLYTPNPSADDFLIPGSAWGVRPTPARSLCIYSNGTQLLSTQTPYPQPYKLSAHTIINVPVPEVGAGSNVSLQLCDLALRPLGQPFESRIDVHDNRLVAQYPIEAGILPGVYLLVVKHSDNNPLIHKIVVER